MGQAWSRCTCLMTQGACDTCNGTGVCLMCDGKGTIVPEHDIEVFSYILDKKGAYRDVKPPPKTCPGCGGWGGVPLFRGINPGVSPSPVMQTGPRKRIGENGEGNGACRKCKGSGLVLVQPEWMREQIAASSPPKFQMGGNLITSPQKFQPMRVPGQKLLQ